MKNLKINWPAIIGITVALTLVSCHNEKKAEEYKKEQAWNNITSMEQNLNEAKQNIFDQEVDEIIYPEEWQVEESGFSK